MFNTRYSLDKAVLEGRKTQTRRVIKCPREFNGKYVAGIHIYKNAIYGDIPDVYLYDEEERDFEGGQICYRYKIGEFVAVAQRYSDIGIDQNAIVGKGENGSPITAIQSKGWNNKMFVKTELMTHHIQINSVRVQRLQDISDEDCLAEGIIKRWHAPSGAYHYYLPNFIVKTVDDVYLTAKEAYAALIDKIGKKGDWEANPYVWVYEFELIG